MSAVDVAEKRINDSMGKIFTLDEYPKFLSFSSNFLKFSYKNIILIYLQDSKAKYIAGINAWKNLTGLKIKKGTTPILILYPSLSSGFKYEVQKLFDFRFLDNENISEDIVKKSINKCDKLFKAMQHYLESLKISVYPMDDMETSVSFEDGIISVDATLSDEEKFIEVLKIFIEGQIRNKDYDNLVSGSIINSSIYLIHSYYGLDTSKIVFPYIKLPMNDDAKHLILSQSFLLSNKITENLDSFKTGR